MHVYCAGNNNRPIAHSLKSIILDKIFRTAQTLIFLFLTRYILTKPLSDKIFAFARRTLHNISPQLYGDENYLSDVKFTVSSVGELLGFRVEDEDKIETIRGVGGEGIAIIIKKVKVKIGDMEVPSRIAWSLTEDVSLLLGRLDVFDIFEILFRKNSSTTFRD